MSQAIHRTMQQVERALTEALALAAAAREHIHRHPELSGQERETATLIVRTLEGKGFELLPIPGQVSLLAYLPGHGRYAVGLRADMDALPIQEQTNLPYASQHPGIMHACGHDIHLAVALGLALAAVAMPTDQRPDLLVCFESSEEVLPGGALPILASPAFQRHRPDIMLALHAEPTLPVGALGMRPGPYMASGNEVNITLRGRGGHAALPHGLVDPIVCAAQTIIALQTIASRNAHPLLPTVLSFGHIENGGAMNIVPDWVRLEGTLRTFDEQWRAEAKERIAHIATHTAQAMGATAEVDIVDGYPTLVNSPSLVAQAKRILASSPAIDAIVDLEQRMTTDDFAYFAQQMPSLYFRLGVDSPHGLHSAHFCPKDGAIEVGVRAMLALVLGLQPPA
ncbi:MAG: N-acyl-L-amino acid amidohydrolase [Bacteroidia bacterium]|nr:MAG: N-acyl-L-amino acid amidohydrolase [Bacteroidia bacterium]